MLINLPEVRGVYRYNVLMSKMTWLNVGGPIDVLFKPRDVDDLTHLIKNTGLPIGIIGATSNIIIRDSGIRGITVKLGREFTYIRDKGNDTIIVGGAVLLSNLACFAEEQQIGGLEFLVGIPGTVGGGIEMNAGAYGNDIASILQSVTAVNLEDGKSYVLSSREMGYFYRGHSLKGKWAFVEAEFRGVKSEHTSIQQKMKNIIDKKNQSQPTGGKTAGCIFKNGESYQAWKLIDQSWCRGLSVGGAKISNKHCNFFLNYNNATALDLENLGNKVQEIVKSKFNVELEWEIRVIS